MRAGTAEVDRSGFGIPASQGGAGIGGPYRDRTYDKWIKSPLLYQLS